MILLKEELTCKAFDMHTDVRYQVAVQRTQTKHSGEARRQLIVLQNERSRHVRSDLDQDCGRQSCGGSRRAE